MKKTHFVYICILLIFAFLWNAFMCTMSPLRDPLFSVDSNCFYIEGKSMALGLKPYVDFVDTKGILLFFIYMVAYLISPEQTLGVYILASLATGITFVFLFKIAQLYRLKNHLAFLSVACCAFFLFYYPIYGYGARTEQFMMPFIAWVMYTSCKLTLNQDSTNCTWRHFACSIGISTAAIFLIKYNCIIYPVSTLLLSSLLFYNHQDRAKIVWILVKYVPLTFLIFCLPFILYLAYIGSLTAFVDVYFKLTSSTTLLTGSNFIVNSIGILSGWMNNPVFFWALISILALFIPFYSTGKKSLSREFLFFSSIALIGGCVLGCFHYYALAFMPLMIYPIIPAISMLKLKKLTSLFLIICVTIISLNSNFLQVRTNYNIKFRKAYPDVCKNYSEIEKVIASKHRAKLIYLDRLACGFSIRTGAIPACPNFMRLNHTSGDIMSSAYEAVKSRTADFVITTSECNKRTLLEKSGYKLVTEFLDGEYCKTTNLLWSKDYVDFPKS